ncbi:elongation factor EF-2 [Candidatus Woesearchaeota archaeon]|nr:elongation factor EF-2 [Candidatus Woesearchaeota archaeon]
MGEKMNDRIGRIMKDPQHIRNICTSAHIHHGKTAFTDNLLAASGLMAEKFAGDLDKGMATWQHSDEQERLLTVDAANVSMVHDYQEKEYLINLIDTPGHVDFGGNVTRAMRAIDGTIVLVCGSEGIMPQTETVIKQALRERVKPVLFINKVDRLIKELQLPPEKIQERIAKIIIEFNQLIEDIAEPDYRQKWKVNAADGSVAFGSARDNWALSIPYMQKKNIKFAEVLDGYKIENPEERKQFFWEKAPLYEVIMDMVVKHLPNPLEAQPYRVPKIWHGEPESALGQGMLKCDPNGKLSFCITRVLIDPKTNREISAGRLYSGTMKEGMTVYLNMQKKQQRIQNVYMYVGIKNESFDNVPSGNVLAIGGIDGYAGETITEEPDQPFEELKHIFEPVITKSVRVVNTSDLPKLVEVLRRVAKEDPSIKIEIHEETGENLMSGMGELHLEIVENRIVTEKGLKIQTSAPIVVYRESITAKSPEVEGKSPNKHNKFYFVVEPVSDEIYNAIKEGKIPETRPKKKDLVLKNALVEFGMDSKEAESVKDVYKGNIFVDATRGQVYLGEVIEMIIDMFEDVMNGGPLAREPCIKVKVSLMDMKLHEDAIHRGPAQVYPAVRDGIRDAMMLARPIMFEPKQVQLIEAPIDYMSDISKLVHNKRGQLLEMHQEGNMVAVKGKLPVAELLGWSNDLRSATSGRGVSSLVDQTFERMPDELQEKVKKQIRSRKGIAIDAEVAKGSG